MQKEKEAVDPRLLLAAIVESSDDAIISKDLDGIVTSWNAAAEAMFGYKPEEMVGQSIVKLIPKRLRGEEPEILRKIAGGDRIVHHETRRLHKDGHELDVSLTISPIRDDDGNIIGASKIARDIHERKESAEARLRLAAIVDSADDAIISKDLNGIITSWNAAAERMFGYTPEEIVGKSILTLIPEKLHGEEPEILRRVRAGLRIEHHETQRISKTGEIRDVSLTISPIKDAAGHIIGVSKIARDISERKRAQLALIQSEKLAATGRLAAAIAHEINNPLEAVTNLAYLLSTNPSLNEEARSYAEMLLSEVSRASAITHQTLAFHRDSANPADVQLASLFEDLLRLHRRKLEVRGIRLVCDFDDSAVVWGYGSELRQVFSNLLLNAMEAIPDNGEVRLRIRFCGADKSKVSITVADNGCGMPPSVRQRIFEPFFTTKLNTGTGLGLWISLGIVDKHQGSIRVRTATSAGLRGTVFRVVLPRNPQLNGNDIRINKLA